MPNEAVVNASPLICLFKVEKVDILGALYRRIVVTESVIKEIQVGADGPDLERILRNFPWVNTVEDPEIPRDLIEWGLGRGETSLLSWALQNPETEVLIDDRAALRCAQFHGLSTRGTLGVLLLAKKRGKLKEISGVLDELVESGLWVSDQLLKNVLESAGEKK